MKVNRRLGKAPQARGCLTDSNCPDVFELSDGRFAVIGLEMTEELRGLLPSDAGVGPDERVVVLPREVLIEARQDIPHL
ncbi:hypothetical protein FBY22_6765 [Streptomyces sp. SLBN-31]|nr:hypothetical protein FBY22_6765 [Streptomyces sp. SLBN-31]